MNGGSTAHTRRSPLDGSSALFSGHSAGGGDWRPSTLTRRSIFSRADSQEPQVAQRPRRLPPKPWATCDGPITGSPRPRAAATTAGW
jgi:hypothetical protein